MMSEHSREQLTLRQETAKQIRRAAQDRGLDVDQFLQQLVEEADESVKRSASELEGSHAFLDDWHPPASLRDWIGLARSEPSDVESKDQDARVQRIHEKHADRRAP